MLDTLKNRKSATIPTLEELRKESGLEQEKEDKRALIR